MKSYSIFSIFPNTHSQNILLSDITWSFQSLLCLFMLTSLTHSWSWTLLKKPPIVQLLKKFQAFYGTRRFITVITRTLHWSRSWARSIQSIPPHPISLRSSYLCLGLLSGLFISGFPTNILYAFLLSQFVLHALPILSSLTYHSNYTWRGVQIMKPSLCSFLQLPVTSSLFGPNILLSTLFLNTLSLCSSLNVRDHVSHPYRTTSTKC
jgi:hypothetical protein